MNAPHWHLALNHLPVVGVFLVVILLGYALLRGRGELYGVSLGALVLLALATIPVFFTGRSADDALMDVAGVDDGLIHIHEAAANLAFAGIGILGVIALAALLLGRNLPHVSHGTAMAVFLLALVETALMGQAANLGGQSRRPDSAPGNPRRRSSAHCSGKIHPRLKRQALQRLGFKICLISFPKLRYYLSAFPSSKADG